MLSIQHSHHIMSSDTNPSKRGAARKLRQEASDLEVAAARDEQHGRTCFAAAQYKRSGARKLRQEAFDLEVAAARDEQHRRTYLQQARLSGVAVTNVAVTKLKFQAPRLLSIPNPATQEYRRRAHVESSSARPAAAQSSSARPLARLTLRSRSPQSRSRSSMVTLAPASRNKKTISE